MKKKLLLLDGNSLLFRCYYATCYGGLLTSKERPTNALHIMGLMIFNILEQEHPDHFIVAFDTEKPTFRHQVFLNYKAQRDPVPEELIAQMAPAREMFRAFGAAVMELDGHEADDIIGTFCQNKEVDILIMTQDKDLYQLINDNVRVVRADKQSKASIIDSRVLLESEGLTPLQIIDYKALVGDVSDNIPGIKGIGEKTAKKLLNQYQNLEGIYNNIAAISGSLKEKLVGGQEIGFISKQLATININVPIDINLSRYIYNGIDYPKLTQFFDYYQLKTLKNRLNNHLATADTVTTPNEQPAIKVETVTIVDQRLLVADSFFSFVLEEENYHRSKIIGACFGQKEVVFIKTADLLNDTRFLDFLAGPVFKGAYDIKECLVCARRLKIELNNFNYDISLSRYLIRQAKEEAAEIFADYHLTQCYKNQVFTKRLYNEDAAISYFACLVGNSFLIYQSLIDEVTKLGMKKLLMEIEIPLVAVLAEMEIEGVKVSRPILDQLNVRFNKKLHEIENEIYTLAGVEFNIASPKELAGILFDKLGLPVNKKRSTGIEVLLSLKDKHPIIALIIQFRKYYKLISTYTGGLSEYIYPDNKFHTIFNQSVTATGRLSSQSPNLQQIAARDAIQKEVRKAFVAGENNYIVSFDYSQIELRILAHLANDEQMIKAFNDGIDIHSLTASKIFAIPLNKVGPDLRFAAKAINFGILYGMSDYSLAEETGLSFEEAKKFIQSYFINFPNIKSYLDNIVQQAKLNGQVYSMFNRLRSIPQILSQQFFIKEQGIRIAKNSPIQGSAADIVKIAMLNVDNFIKNNNLKTKMIMQVHDELIFEMPLAELDDIEKIKTILENACPLSVKLEVNYGYGLDLFEAK